MTLKKLITLFSFCLIISYALSTISEIYASEAGGKDEALNITIDTKDLSGINLWIVETYNNDRMLYAVIVTLVMATLGSVLAFGTDLILKYFGMGVTKISHSE
jgi:hypothetical protein